MSLLQNLIRWQKETADREHLEPYMVVQFGTLREIARIKPKTREELLRIKGIGPAKIHKYGDAILDIVRNNGIVGGDESVSAQKKSDLFEEARTVNELAGKAKNTVNDAITIDNITGEVVEEKSSDAISVSQFIAMLNTMFRANFRHIRIKGEVVGFKRHQSGHAYFDIKDTDSVLRCAVFKNNYELAGIDMADGMEIIITGSPNYHEKYGFSFIGETIELYGEGALKKAYDALRKKLEKEGLFAKERKRAVPQLPHRIGLITSRSGAAIGDFTTNIGQFGYKILFYHSSVEGANAIRELKDALTIMARKNLDVLVIVRGGGSLESLQAFNNEMIVRMIVDFPVPVVAGVGHERDETLATLVADVGVSTPTAAAHAVRGSWDRVEKFLVGSEEYITHSYDKVLSETKIRLLEQEHEIKDYFAHILQDIHDVFDRFAFSVQKLDGEIIRKKKHLHNTLIQYGYFLNRIMMQMQQKREKAIRILLHFQTVLDAQKKRIVFLERAVANYDPRRQLALGYSIATRKNGRIIRHKKDVKKGDAMNVQVSDGVIESRVK